MRTPSFSSRPFYAKLALVLISLISLGYLFIIGKPVLSPLLFSLLFAIALLPLAKFFENKLKLPRSAASALSVLILLVAVVTILYLVGTQLTNLADDWPQFKDQLTNSLNNIQEWVRTTFHVAVYKQMNYVHNATDKMLAASTAVIGTAVISLSSILLFLVFVMFYTFFFLFYRRLLVKFLISVFKEENSETVYDIIEQVQYIIQKYLSGLLLEMGIVATVACLAFWILGIKYAILLGIITGLFNIVPYIGIFTALLISTLITFATTAALTKVILVAAVVIGIHLIDSNILLPVIVGSKVKINAFITLLGVILGEHLWSIAGMFLSIPYIAITKIVFDRIEELKPWGMLLGEEKDEKRPPPLEEEIEEGDAKKNTVNDSSSKGDKKA